MKIHVPGPGFRLLPLLWLCLLGTVTLPSTQGADLKPQDIPVVRTFGELLAAPVLDPEKLSRIKPLGKEPSLAGAKIHLGLSRASGDLFDGALLYMLVEAPVPPDLNIDTTGDAFGPFLLTGMETMEKLREIPHPTVRLEGENSAGPNRHLLLVKTVPFSQSGLQQTGLTLPGSREVLATARVEVSSREGETWYPWENRPDSISVDKTISAPLTELVGNPGNGSALPESGPSTFWLLPVKTEPAKPLPLLWSQKIAPNTSCQTLGNRVDIRLDREYDIGSPRDFFLTRWWINGKPVPLNPRIPSLAAALQMAMEPADHIRFKIDFDPTLLSAKEGDRVGLQLLFCPDGWKYTDPSAMANLALRDMTRPTPAPLSNQGISLLLPRVEFVWQDGLLQTKPSDLPLSLTLSSERTEYLTGDLIPITFHIKNTGKEDYGYSDRNYDRSGRMEEFFLQAVDTQGKPAPDPRAAHPFGIMGGLAGFGKLKPGESFTKTIYLNQWAHPLPPGTWQIKGRYTMEGEELSIPAPPLEIRITARTAEESAALIQKLASDLREAGDPHDDDLRKMLLQQLAWLGNPAAIPALLEFWYLPSRDSFPITEAFTLYLPPSPEITARVMEAAREKGLARDMFYVLTQRGVSKDRIKPLIPISLKSSRSATLIEAALAAQQIPGDAISEALIPLAEDPAGPARQQAIYALSRNRTDATVDTLKKLLADPDENIRKITADTIRSAYQRKGIEGGRPFQPDDFDVSYQKEK